MIGPLHGDPVPTALLLEPPPWAALNKSLLPARGVDGAKRGVVSGVAELLLNCGDDEELSRSLFAEAVAVGRPVTSGGRE